MNVVRARIGEGGRVVIPADYRRALGWEVGDEIVLEIDDHELRALKIEDVILRAQALVRRYVPAGRSLVNELIAERRDDAAHG